MQKENNKEECENNKEESSNEDQKCYQNVNLFFSLFSFSFLASKLI